MFLLIIINQTQNSNKIVTLAGKRSFVPNFDGPEILGPKNFPMLDGGGYSTPFATFDSELRNERFTLISFIGFPAILSTLQPFEICIFNRT